MWRQAQKIPKLYKIKFLNQKVSFARRTTWYNFIIKIINVLQKHRMVKNVTILKINLSNTLASKLVLNWTERIFSKKQQPPPPWPSTE